MSQPAATVAVAKIVICVATFRFLTATCSSGPALGPTSAADGPITATNRNAEPTDSAPPTMWKKRSTIITMSADAITRFPFAHPRPPGPARTIRRPAAGCQEGDPLRHGDALVRVYERHLDHRRHAPAPLGLDRDRRAHRGLAFRQPAVPDVPLEAWRVDRAGHLPDHGVAVERRPLDVV